MHSGFDNLLGELAVLASNKQRDMGQHPSRWLARWRTEVSLSIAVSVGKALLAAVPPHARPFILCARVDGGRGLS